MAISFGDVEMWRVGHENEDDDENHRDEETQDVEEDVADVRADAVGVENADCELGIFEAF
jgi:hypothetical protein